MPELSTQGVVREILTTDPEMQTDEIIRKAKAKGLRVPDEKIRKSIHNLRNPIRATVASSKIVTATAHETAPPKAVPVEKSPVSVTTTEAPALDNVLANVFLVNKIAKLCGGIENARQAAEAVQACGSTEAFLQHLDLVSSIRSTEAAK